MHAAECEHVDGFVIQHRHAQDTEWSDEMRLSLSNPQLLNDGKEIAYFVIGHLLVGQPYHVRVASYTEGVGDSAFAELLSQLVSAVSIDFGVFFGSFFESGGILRRVRRPSGIPDGWT